MKKIELLSPAGDLERLKVTLLYGADAVYIGGEKFSLRANATNFTFEEMKEAVRLNKPYWFMAHRDVTFCRQLQRKLVTPIDFNFKKKDDNKYFFDARTLEIYDFAIKSYEKDVANRTGNWVQEFYRLDEILKYIITQFEDTDRIEQIIKEGGNNDIE